ncbi:MAG: hypothetical protein LBC51_00010 [Treponema sp.]|jgi:dihydropyrimidine dehydrogenase (NAD+) subunit PreA|nr:hypothetical protein [Treponema sp.]
MRQHQYRSVAELVRKDLKVFAAAHERDRQSLEPALLNENKCLGCGRCYISCSDAGHGAVNRDIRKQLPAIDLLPAWAAICVCTSALKEH